MKTGNQSVELAASYLLTCDTVGDGSQDGSDDGWDDVEENYKMVFAVNTDLGMSIGKTAAQVLNLYLSFLEFGTTL